MRIIVIFTILWACVCVWQFISLRMASSDAQNNPDNSKKIAAALSLPFRAMVLYMNVVITVILLIISAFSG
jgi:hypothetical protein